MFKTDQVKAYLKSIAFKIEDGKRICTTRFFVTPITHTLAAEASPAIAGQLFRNNGTGYQPVLELGRTEFTIQVPVQSMSYKRHHEYTGHDVLIPEVTINGISAQKVVPGDPNFSLIFNASFEILDKSIVPDLVDLLHENVYLTFAPMQPSLFSENYDDVLCRMCDAPNVEFIVEHSKPVIGYCAKHSGHKEDSEVLVRVRNFEAARAVAAENAVPTIEVTVTGVDPLAATSYLEGWLKNDKTTSNVKTNSKQDKVPQVRRHHRE